MASRLLQIRRIKAPGAWARWAGTLACLGALTVGMPRAAAKQKPLPTKTISGLVLDASGRGISGASVLLTDLATRKTQAIYSGTNGGYNFSGLIPYDDYKVLARYHGMESRARRVSSADPRTAIVVDLTVGASKPNS
ncbi:MAG: carboxypeptidase-like regulatory domain-containing protein [Terriglobia bacterium]